jgi:IMP cyclohydrolase
MATNLGAKRNEALANANLIELGLNEYPGRGIVVGLEEKGKYVVQIYWIMGRSENSRNRIFKSGHGKLFTAAADTSKMKDPSLVIYNAMRECAKHYIVSNGSQTDNVARAPDPLVLNVGLHEVEYEPDAPHFTQRITAVCTIGGSPPYAQMMIHRKSVLGTTCDTVLYGYDLHRGFGYCMTTYAHDGNPLPPFKGDPYLVPLSGSITSIANLYWSKLNEENRISLAVKFIDVKTGKSKIHIINKYKQVR